MAFAIVSTLLMVIDLAFYGIAVGEMQNYVCDPNYYYPNCYYTTNSTGVAIYSCLLALSVAELGISIAVAILCCKYGCSGCCDGETRGVRLFFSHDYYLHHFSLIKFFFYMCNFWDLLG